VVISFALPGVIALGVSCQAVLLVVVLLALPSGNRVANRYLALFLTVEAIRLAGYAILFSDILAPFPFYFAPAIGVLAAPLLYLYVRALVDPNPTGWSMYGRAFAPILPIYIAAVVVGLRPATPGEFMGYEPSTTGPWPWFSLAYELLFIAYTVAALRLLAGHRARIEKLFSSVKQLDLRWLRLMLLVMLVSWVGYWLVDFLRLLGVLELSSRVYVNVLSSLIIIYLISIGGMRQPEIFTADVRTLYSEVLGTTATIDATPPMGATGNNSGSSGFSKAGIDVESAVAMWSNIGEHMREHKTFLDHQLSLKDVATQLQMSPQILSLILNRHANMSFYDYINSLRIAHATELLLRPDKTKTKLLAIADEAGFNSQATFYKHFRKIQGMTPKQYRLQAHRDERD
jgi:AraC-like DNA-binding protein